MKVSVIIPCRDRLESLDRCLSSIERSIDAVGQDSSTEAFQILIVNDRSSPNFRTDVELLHPRVDIIDAEGIGPGAARNTALARTDADLYLLTDSDCVVSPDWCREALAWYRARHSTMAQGVPWLFQRRQNADLGASEEALYRHMFSTYLAGGTTSMIDSRNMLVARGHFDQHPRKIFADQSAQATAESRILLGDLLKNGFKIDWCPKLEVYHEDPADAAAGWRQKYRHGSGRYYIWHNLPAIEFLLDRYFVSPIKAGNDPSYVIPAHLAFLMGYRDARMQKGEAVSAWWKEVLNSLSRRLGSAASWIGPVQNAVSHGSGDDRCIAVTV
jgi:glycosyltransferase involved in cell wall biosynthesis